MEAARRWRNPSRRASLIRDEWKQRHARAIDILRNLRGRGIAAGVHTQTTDVENEINVLLTCDRIPKIDTAWLKQPSDRLMQEPDVPP